MRELTDKERRLIGDLTMMAALLMAAEGTTIERDLSPYEVLMLRAVEAAEEIERANAEEADRTAGVVVTYMAGALAERIETYLTEVGA